MFRPDQARTDPITEIKFAMGKNTTLAFPKH